MGVIVRLAKILEALESPEEWEVYLDRNTGEIVTVTDNESPYLEDEVAEIDDLPDWQRESITEVRKALESADLVPLPSKFDIHEWDLMRRFALSQDEPARGELLNAIHGKGAFRLFRHTADRLDLRDSWFAYRDAAIRDIATFWLEENGIAFVED